MDKKLHLVITLEGGLVSSVGVKGEGFDIDCIENTIIDYDVECAEVEDISIFKGSECYVNTSDCTYFLSDEDMEELEKTLDS